MKKLTVLLASAVGLVLLEICEFSKSGGHLEQTVGRSQDLLGKPVRFKLLV